MSVLTRLNCSINGSDGFPNENSGTKPTVNPLLSPLGGLFISSPFEGGLFERWGLFNLETTMVSVLHKELEYQPHSQVLSPTRRETLVGSGHVAPRIWEITNKQLGGETDKCEICLYKA